MRDLVFGLYYLGLALFHLGAYEITHNTPIAILAGISAVLSMLYGFEFLKSQRKG